MSALRSIGALPAGIAVGVTVNMALVTVAPNVIPPPEGVDVTNMESIAASIHLFEAKHFVFPFLAHALGTLSGSLVGYLIAARGKEIIAYVIGALSFAGGIAASRMIPAPITFIVIDLVFAYFPMAWLAVRLGVAAGRRHRASA
jgi:hypothetical protein